MTEMRAASAQPQRIAIVGGGPAGLMVAEGLLAGSPPGTLQVDLFDAMPSVGRKFLLAGKGGLNLTHSEAIGPFLSRYGERRVEVGRWLAAFGPEDLRAWARGLGIDTFVGSSGKVFPQEMKAAPLLRAWLHRLRTQGLRLHMRHRWLGDLQRAGPDGGVWQLTMQAPAGEVSIQADTVVLALGGASWQRLGSDGAWVPWLAQMGVDVAPLRPANCGFDVDWSSYLRERHAGAPLKNVRLRVASAVEPIDLVFDRVGEAVLTATGIEGALVYAASAMLRELIAAQGGVDVALDLLPTRDEGDLALALARGRGTRSYANHLREHAGLHGAKAALLREGVDASTWLALQRDAAAMARRIKALPLRLLSPRPVDEAISTAGGVRFEALDSTGALLGLPSVYCAGEMLDWEAPTGGYLLTACVASGRAAAAAVLAAAPVQAGTGL